MGIRNLEKRYTLKEVADITGIHYKRVQRKARKTNVKKLGKEYLVNSEWVSTYFNVDMDSYGQIKMSTVKNNMSIGESKPMSIETLIQTPNETQEENKSLKSEVEQLRGALASHNKLFRMLSNRLRQLENNDNKEVIQETVQDITEELPEPPLQVYKTPKTPRELYNSIHPPNTTVRTKDGKEIPKPSMNDVNFQSSYDPNWNKDNE